MHPKIGGDSSTDGKVREMVERVRKAGQKQPSASEVLEEIRKEEGICMEIKKSINEVKEKISKKQEEIEEIIQKLGRKTQPKNHI